MHAENASVPEFSPRQNAVLEQALRLLVDGGEKALTTSGLARAASCSKESLYKWFGDRDGLRLELCLDDVPDPLCGIDARPNPDEPLSMPENFPDESFWWSAEALMETAAGVRARLVLAQEAAFGGPGEVAVDQQVAFSRLRIRMASHS